MSTNKLLPDHADKDKFNSMISELLQPINKGEVKLETNESYPTQETIKKNIPLITKEKLYDIRFPSDKTGVKYSSNGRFMIINTPNNASVFDTKKLNVMFERNISGIFDSCFLHDESFFAVAKTYKTPIITTNTNIESAIYIYDKVGRELHHLKNHRNPRCLTFLPYHFLLASVSTSPHVRWTDITNGKIVGDFYTKEKYLCMNHNPNTAVLHCGSVKGTVTLWSPASSEFISKIFCHNGPVKHINFFKNFMVTSDENLVKIWDSRMDYKPVKQLFASSHSSISVSQGGKIATGFKNTIKFFDSEEDSCFYKYKSNRPVYSLEWQPFEDILTVGSDGIFSLIIPGSGTPYYDSYEENPFITKKQRQEREVKRLLEKIPYTLIGKELTDEILD
ncbi:WD repeat-containing protein 46 [Cucumispora dikerogammari]|nr:WD repeat-containing protein 46 [Cucumispora dikerogammari]